MKGLVKGFGGVVILCLLGVAAWLVHRVYSEGRTPFPSIDLRPIVRELPRVIVERIPVQRPAEAPVPAAAEAPIRDAGPLDAETIEEAFPGAVTAHDAETLRRLYSLGLLKVEVGDEAAARAAFDSVIRSDPQSLYAQRSYIQIGNILERGGDHAGAIREYDRALALRPDDPVALHNRALAFVRAGDLEEALRSAERAAMVDPNDASTMLNLGNIHLALGECTKAIRAFRAVIDSDSRRPEAYFNLGLACYRQGRMWFPEAAAALETCAALSTGPAAVAARSLQGTILFERGLFEEAANAYGAAAALEPDTYVHYFNRGVALAKADPQGILAVESFEEALRRAPDDPRIRFNLGALYLARGDLERAVREYEAGLSRAPNDPAARLILGYALQQLQRSPEAEAAYRKVIEIGGPEAEKAWLNLGLILEARGETDAAVEAYRKGPPDDPLTHFNAGLILARSGRTADAVPLLEEARRKAAQMGIRDPRFERAHAEALAESGRLDDALAAYRAALQAGGPAAEIRYRLGLLLVQRRRPEEAEAEFRAALDAAPPAALRALALVNLGALLDAQGRTEDAIAAYREAIAVDARRPETYYNLALLYQRAEKYDRAVEALQSVLRLGPTPALEAKARTALGNVFHARGLLEEAAREYERAVLLDRTLLEARFNLRAVRGESGAVP